MKKRITPTDLAEIQPHTITNQQRSRPRSWRNNVIGTCHCQSWCQGTFFTCSKQIGIRQGRPRRVNANLTRTSTRFSTRLDIFHMIKHTRNLHAQKMELHRNLFLPSPTPLTHRMGRPIDTRVVPAPRNCSITLSVSPSHVCTVTSFGGHVVTGNSKVMGPCQHPNGSLISVANGDVDVAQLRGATKNRFSTRFGLPASSCDHPKKTSRRE